MSHAGTRAERESWKQQCEAKFAEPGFIRGKVEPLVPELAGNGDRAATATFARAKATGRMTLRYDFEEAAAVYAKAYYGNGLGLRAYEWLRLLWKDGFDSESCYRVPEPLGYLEEDTMLLMREVHGTPASELAAEGPREKAVEAMRLAARWLLRFHQSHLEALDVEPPCEQIEVLKTAALLAKVAAQFPERASALIDMVHQLREFAPSAASPVGLVPLHGQYRPAHVLINCDSVCVIDLDKIRLSDPAKDVSRFVHVLKKTCYEAGGDAARADLLGREFVDEYRKGAPANLANLAYFDGLYALKAFAKVVKGGKVGEPAREAMERLYLDDFQRATQQPAASKVA